MNLVIYFTHLFESIPDYKKIVLLIFLIKNYVNFLYECWNLKRDNNFLYKEYKSILLELNEEFLDHIKNEEESVIQKFLNKKKEQYFSNLLEDVRHERSLILLLTVTDADMLRQNKFRDNEIQLIKNLALEKLHKKCILKEHVAMDLLGKQFSDQSI